MRLSTIVLTVALLAPLGAAAQEKPAPEQAKKPAAAAGIDYRRFDFSRCVVKPVMSDEDLRRCGATPTQPQF